jgi:hypothetical protein
MNCYAHTAEDKGDRLLETSWQPPAAHLRNAAAPARHQAVKRNPDRFPAEFRCELTREKIPSISQTVTSLRSLRYRTLIAHDAALPDLYRKLRPLLLPVPAPPKRQIGFHTLK